MSVNVSQGVQGHVRPGFEPVRAAFAENFARRGELGGTCCVYYRYARSEGLNFLTMTSASLRATSKCRLEAPSELRVPSRTRTVYSPRAGIAWGCALRRWNYSLRLRSHQRAGSTTSA
jgi:hypothetical protein